MLDPFMNSPLDFLAAARLPAETDNVAIAVKRLEAGAAIALPTGQARLPFTILEGHRFAIRPVAQGESLTSWGLPFGRAVEALIPGEYACNAAILKALAGRRPDFSLPERPNFVDARIDFDPARGGVACVEQVARHTSAGSFKGFWRGGLRGAGTRNFIAVLGVSSRASSMARTLAAMFREAPGGMSNFDGVVALCHTEGGGSGRPHNLELSARTLAGLAGHPNLSAVLAIDEGGEGLNNALLREGLRQRWPGENLPALVCLSLRDGWDRCRQAGAKLITGWLDWAKGMARTEVPLEFLRVGLQCGGSDAFSGVSGNPLVGWVSKELVRYGGAANLAETSELIGAEPYVLARVKSEAVALKFLETQRRFQEWAGWHGHSAEGNPSGGNMYRGLYNISIKSIGAARKKDPEVRLDGVIDYAEPMPGPGYYFMDSPGNDLESIAGQVASGCNLILFATGNGSITNFPFVPTIKVMTNTGRFEMLSRDMDFNAGRYLDGESMENLGQEAFGLTVRVASGERTVGERAGHSQLQLWREWRQTSATSAKMATSERKSLPLRVDSEPLPPMLVEWLASPDTIRGLESIKSRRRSVGLVLPTSLCAGQIASRVAEQLSQDGSGSKAFAAFAALPHTEGCGNSGGDSEEILMRVMSGHLRHPRVGAGLLMEHGCEKTHNDAFRLWIGNDGADLNQFGWSSIQLDGGIDATVAKSKAWFLQRAGKSGIATTSEPYGPALGIAWTESLPEAMGRKLSLIAKTWLSLGGTVVVAPGEGAGQPEWLGTVQDGESIRKGPTLACGERFKTAGMHWMDTPTDDLVEAWSALAATGVEVLAVVSGGPVYDHHPFIPMVAWSNGEGEGEGKLDSGLAARAGLDQLLRAGSGEVRADAAVAFQVTRGRFGVSL